MLAGFGARLQRAGHAVVVTGRTSRDANGLAVIGVDWRDPAGLAHVGTTVRPDAIVAWVHAEGRAALRRLAYSQPQARVLHVRGSAAGREHAPPSVVHGHAGGFQEVVLGCMPGPRWLTHHEICDGVYEAWVSGRPRTRIGTISA